MKVFPLQKNGKKPLKGSKGFYDATDDIKQLQKWWRENPNYNIGIATGEVSNLTVIDADGPEGLKSTRQIDQLVPFDTMVIKTPHGYHFYFKYNPEFTTGVGFLKGLDVRNDKGYVVAPTSVVECDKRVCDINHGTEYKVHQDVARKRIKVVPDVFKKGPRIQAAGTDSRENIRQLVNGVEHGNRDQSLTSLLGTLFHMRLTKDGVRAILYYFADNCRPPLEHGVVDEKMQRMAQVYVYPEPSPIDEYINPVEQAYRRLAFTRPAEWLDEPEEEDGWIVEGLVPSKALVMTVAFPKGGKSTFTRQLGLSVARGEEFLCRAVVQGKVLYLAVEEYHKRVKQSFRRLGITKEDPLLLKFGKPDQHAIEDLRIVIGQEKPVLVIIDTVTRMPKAKFEMQDYFGNAEWLEPYLYMAHELGVTIMVNYHSSRTGRTLEGVDAIASPLGSTGILGTPDQFINIKVESNNNRSISTVGRFEPIPPTLISFDRESHRLDVLGEKSVLNNQRLKEEIRAAIRKDWASQTQVLENVTGDTTSKLSAFNELISENLVERRGSGRKGSPYEVRGNIPFAFFP